MYVKKLEGCVKKLTLELDKNMSKVVFITTRVDENAEKEEDTGDNHGIGIDRGAPNRKVPNIVTVGSQNITKHFYLTMIQVSSLKITATITHIMSIQWYIKWTSSNILILNFYVNSTIQKLRMTRSRQRSFTLMQKLKLQ